MQHDIYQKFPSDVRRLVDKIEDASGIDIEVRGKSERKAGERIAEAVGEEVVGALMSADSIIIESPTTIDEISFEYYVHELLHLELIYVYKIPHLCARKNSDDNAAANIDNYLEHIVIYARQIDLCPRFHEKLDGYLTKFWETNVPTRSDMLTLRFNLLTRYMLTRKYGCSSSKRAMAKALKAISLSFSIRDEARACLAVSTDKRAFVSRFLEALQISKNLFWLRQHEAPGRPFSYGPI